MRDVQDAGRVALERAQGDAVWSGGAYLLASGTWITLVLLPATVCMGATFPLALSALRKTESSERPFSHLYVANVLGATSGTLIAAFVLIEILGFRNSLLVAATLNAALLVGAFALARSAAAVKSTSDASADRASSRPRGGTVLVSLLFMTGLLSMAMEVVWVRQFTPFLGTFVYAFALILASYLAATFAGSVLYRTVARRRPATGTIVWALAGAFALLPLVASDPNSGLPWGLPWAVIRLWIGVLPISAAFGYLTPMLVDRYSDGDPERAGKAYAINVVGCILGPLIGCFVLLPAFGERVTNLVLTVPVFLVALVFPLRSAAEPASGRPGRRRAVLASCLAASALLILLSKPYESRFPSYAIRRDSTATAIAVGQGMKKDLFVNGISMTSLSPVTKMMVHLPMAWRPEPPRDVLVICFGMGTSFRSGLSWGASCTTVDLVPSVPELFEYFHSDAADVRLLPGARIVVDDGRRFLERTTGKFDVIVIDPPPPPEAAGSSLLYSREFYRIAKRRLRPGGILQQWYPGGRSFNLATIWHALDEEFPHVLAFQSFEGWGIHFLASESPLGTPSVEELSSRLPPRAAGDLVEWGPFRTVSEQFAGVLQRRVLLQEGQVGPPAPALTDDQPLTEYFFLRRLLGLSAYVAPGG
jgi:predicted membrane-bound spermidine synthase